MKKTMIAILAAGLCLLAGNVLAGDLGSGEVTDVPGGEFVATLPANASIAKMSTNVLIGATYGAGGYALATYHTSGTKAYATAYDSTALYFDDLGVGGTLTAPSDSNSDVAFPDGGDYTKM